MILEFRKVRNSLERSDYTNIIWEEWKSLLEMIGWAIKIKWENSEKVRIGCDAIVAFLRAERCQQIRKTTPIVPGDQILKGGSNWMSVWKSKSDSFEQLVSTVSRCTFRYFKFSRFCQLWLVIQTNSEPTRLAFINSCQKNTGESNSSYSHIFNYEHMECIEFQWNM